MLAYVLAWVIGLGSLGLYLAAFFFPEIHRRNDFIWSGLGLFYALVLWVYAERLTGAILLGQTASVALLSWFGWETLTLRRQLTPLEERTQLPGSETTRANADLAKTNIQQTLAKQPEKIAALLTKVKDQIQAAVSTVASSRGKAGSETTQTRQTPQSTAAARVKQTIEKDRLEVAPPPAQPVADEVIVKTNQVPAEATPVTEAIKPEVEITPPASGTAEVTKPEVEVTPPTSSTDESIIDEWDRGEPPAEVAPTVKGSEPKPIQTGTSQNAQVKAAATKDLQAKLADFQTKLTNLPIRDRLSKLSEQATTIFTSLRDRAQGILATVTQRRSKPDIETPQQVAAPSIPTDPTAQGSDFDEDAAKEGIEETTSVAAVMDEVSTESTPVAENLQPETDSESAARLLTRQAATASEPPTEPEAQPESTASSLNPLSTEAEAPPSVEEMAPEVELAPPAEPPGQPSEPEPSIEMEVVQPETAPAELKAPSISTSDSGSAVDEEHPELIRPNEPDPSLVEAAQKDAEAKLNQDASEDKQKQNPANST